METKSIFSSKTFWVNIIMATLGCLAVFTPDILTGFGLGENAVEKALVVIGAITTFLNIILRFLTTTQIKFIVLILIISGLSSCSISRATEIYHSKVEKYVKKHNDNSSVTQLPNGAIATRVKLKNLYDPTPVKKTFTVANLHFDAVAATLELNTVTTDTTLKLKLPSFKK